MVWFPLPTPIKSCLPSGVTATAVGYQPVGMKPLTWLRLGRGDVDDGDAVVVGVGHEERLAVGRDGQGVGRAPFGRLGKERRVDRLGDDPAPGVDHRDAVARGAGDEDPVVLGMDGDLVGMLADGDPGDGAQVAGIEDAHRAAGPVGDKQLGAVACEDDVIGPRAGRRGLQLLSIGRGRAPRSCRASTSSE